MRGYTQTTMIGDHASPGPITFSIRSSAARVALSRISELETYWGELPLLVKSGVACRGLLALLLDRPEPIGFLNVQVGFGSAPGMSFAPSLRKWSRPRPIALPFIVCMSRA